MQFRKDISISQSFIKDLIKYRNGDACGVHLYLKYDKGLFDLFGDKDVFRRGKYFEYTTTGNKGKDGKIPEPDRTKKGELTQPYKDIHIQALHFKEIMDYYGFKIKEVDYKIKYKDTEGTLDLLVECKKDVYGYDRNKIQSKGGLIIIDLKYSGLLNNEWSEYGWGLKYFGNKENHLLQAEHYTYLYKMKFGKLLPFMFMIFSSTNPDEQKIINVSFTDDDIAMHEVHLDTVRDWIKDINAKGIKKQPRKDICAECPLQVRTKCNSYVNVPEIRTHYYGTN